MRLEPPLNCVLSNSLKKNQSKSHCALITLLQVSLKKITRMDNSSRIFSSGLLSVTEWIPLLVLVTAECFSTGCTSDPPLWSSVSRTVVRRKRSPACPWCKGETTERRCCILRFRWQRKVPRNLCFHCNYLIFITFRHKCLQPFFPPLIASFLISLYSGLFHICFKLRMQISLNS